MERATPKRPINIWVLGLFTLGAVAASVGEVTAAEPMAGPRPLSMGEGISVERGEAVYSQNCVTCHGLSGRGDGPMSPKWPTEQVMPDLTSKGFLAGRDEELFTNVKEGLRRLEEPLIVMPQFKYILSDEDILSAIKYVQNLPTN